uniref:Putative secreted peptide n=1 Tax=Anopheles braziliensis TaxID=58242 RepID=A0A2M3ZPG5_9DIPT
MGCCDVFILIILILLCSWNEALRVLCCNNSYSTAMEGLTHEIACLRESVIKIGEILSSSSCYNTLTHGSQVPVPKLKSVTNLAELEELETLAKDKRFILDAIKDVAVAFNRDKCIGQGRTIALRVLDLFFKRIFLTECSWTGMAKQANGDFIKSKVAMKEFNNVVDLYALAVENLDPTFSKSQAIKVLRQCMVGAKQRVMV